MALSLRPRALLPAGEFPSIARDAIACVPRALAMRTGVLPYRLADGELHVLVAEAEAEGALELIRDHTGLEIHATLTREQLERRIALAYTEIDVSQNADREDAAPAIRAVDEMHAAAIDAGASDVHLEPTASGGRLRERIDGLLRERRRFDPELFAQVVSRVKVLAAMDIADRRQPQDGRYHVAHHARSIDARVSSMPTISGEKLVIRLLDMHARIPRLEDLGMSAQVLGRFRTSMHAPCGFVVVCGPTGSGKTTTLYAALQERNVEGQHLCTIEDPVEARLPGVTQAQVNVRAGLTFGGALRAFLRQDPNVIMVGEMRDAETASVAMSAALSGALVATTLHANDAPRAIERLVELGLAREAMAAGLSGILAQRLVRCLCVRCRRGTQLTALDALSLGIDAPIPVYAAGGCAACADTGYRGRTGIFEYLRVDEDLRGAIASGASSVDVARLAQTRGFAPMLASAHRILADGTTDVAEIRRTLTIGAAE